MCTSFGEECSLFVAEKFAGVFKPVLDSMRLFLFSMEESTATMPMVPENNVPFLIILKPISLIKLYIYLELKGTSGV